MAGNKSNLPVDIVETILSKLSVKPLHRFKSVSKSWNTIISDPIFVKNHIRRRSNYSNSENLFLCPTSSVYSTGFSVVKLQDKKLQTLQKLEAPFGCGLELGFCEGIILLTNDKYTRLLLWNPSTRKTRKLYYRYWWQNIGLCRDPCTDDFKVVVASEHYYSVYSCRNKSWSMKNEYEIDYTGLSLTRNQMAGVCVDGASYWVWSNHFDDSYKITYYDPREDKFKILQKPENVQDVEQVYLVNLRGSLCTYCYFHGIDRTTVKIWEKENGIDNHSWKELVTVEYKGKKGKKSYRTLWWQPLCFVEDKIVFLIDDDRFVTYFPFGKGFEEYEFDTQLPISTGLVPVQYMESLYFPVEKPRLKSGKRKRKRKVY